MTAQPARRPRSPLYLLVAGAVGGALLTALFIPAAQDDRTVAVGGTAVGGGSPAGGQGGVSTGQGGTGAAASAASGGPADAGSGGQPGGQGGGAGSAGAGTGAGAGTSPGDGGSGAGADPQGGGPAQGVVDSTIRIGVGIPDLGFVEALGPNYDDGDVRGQMEALLQQWHDDGLLPVHGRDIEFFYRSYDIIGTEQQRAACLGWANDDQVFAVITVHDYWAEGPCVAGEYGIPFIGNEAYTRSQIDRGNGLMFTMPYDIDTMYRNMVHWAVAHDIVTDQSRIGLYYGAGLDSVTVTEDAMIAELERLGFGDQIVERVTTDNVSTGSQQDNVAAQRFAAANVDVAIPLVGAINLTNFMQTAEVLRYRPTYVVSDFLYTTNDTAAETLPAAQFDQTLAMTGLRFGEENAGMGLSPEGQLCIDRYAEYSGNTVRYDERPAEWLALQFGCDVSSVLLQALRDAGPDLSRASFVTALENLGPLGYGGYGPLTFGPDHTGGGSQRTLRWEGECTCWRALGVFEPLYAP